MLFWCCQSLFKYLPRHDDVENAFKVASVDWPEVNCHLLLFGGRSSREIYQRYAGRHGATIHAPRGIEELLDCAPTHSFTDGETLTIEPWRARAFPVLRDLVVDRSASMSYAGMPAAWSRSKR